MTYVLRYHLNFNELRNSVITVAVISAHNNAFRIFIGTNQFLLIILIHETVLRIIAYTYVRSVKGLFDK